MINLFRVFLIASLCMALETPKPVAFFLAFWLIVGLCVFIWHEFARHWPEIMDALGVDWQR